MAEPPHSTRRPTPLDVVRELRTWIADQLDSESRGFDREHGTATSWFDLGNYEPTPPSVVEAVLDALPAPLERYAFVDLGSGKGRVVLIAAGRPFRRVVGVERRWMLHRRAQRNAAAYTGRVVTAPEWVHGDVRTAPLPDGPLVLFIYNPFGLNVLHAVLERVAGREVVLAAVFPPDHAWLEAQGFTALHVVPNDVEDRRWSLFRRDP